jgi:ubiquinol-cytochrome c reductase cytochrome c subunit
MAWALLAVGLFASMLSLPAVLDRAGAYEPPGPETAQRGDALYARYCLECHGLDATGTPRGPSLRESGTGGVDFYLRTGRMPIENPDDEPRRSEPIFTEEQIARLVEYLAEMTEGPDIPRPDLEDTDIAQGAELYRLHCAACHNWAGQGGALVHHETAPSLGEASALEVAEAVRVGPGTMPRFAEDTIPDEDLDELVAYVLFLHDPPDYGGNPLGHWGPAVEGAAAAVALAGLVAAAWWTGARR